MTKSTRLALFIILTLILCDCDETTQTNQSQTVQNYKMNGAAKVVQTQERVDETTKVTTETNVQQYKQQKFKMGVANQVALDMQKDMDNVDVSKFIQSQYDAQNKDPKRAQKEQQMEARLDAYIAQYLEQNKAHVVQQEGNVRVETKMQFMKNDREVFYDPIFQKYVWDKASFLIDRNELGPQDQSYQLLDPEYLKDDMIDFISVIKKSTWFVFKFSRFMPFWIDTIGYITNPDFLSVASKDELVYMHYYIKKVFKIFSNVILGKKTSGSKVKQFILVYAQVVRELTEYEYAINLLFKHIKVDNKEDMNDEYANLFVNQKNILEGIARLKRDNFMEPMDVSLIPEITQLDAMITKLKSGSELSMGEVEITTIIKTSIIDIQKKILKKISLLLYGSLLDKFKNTVYYSYLVQMLKSLQDLLNAHILDNDKNVETILDALQLFLIKIEEYLNGLEEQDNSYAVNEGLHGDMLSAAAFFVSNIEKTELPKQQEVQKKFTLFMTRMRLLLLALKLPVEDGKVKFDFDDSDFDPNAPLSDNLDDLFGEFGDLENDPQIQDSLVDLRKMGDRQIYIIEHNIDVKNTEINTQLKNFFDQFKNAIAKLTGMKSVLGPFYLRVLDIFNESEKDFAVLGTVDFLKQLQTLYANIVNLKKSEKEMSQEVLQDMAKFAQVTYGYKFYKENVHQMITQIVRHLTFVCSKCDEEVLGNISNEVDSHLESIVDSKLPSNRLTLLTEPIAPGKSKLVYVVEVLDCENSSIFVKMIPRTNRRFI